MHVHHPVSDQSLQFLANRNAELAAPPLLWSVNCIKKRGEDDELQLITGTAYLLYCVFCKCIKLLFS